MKSPAVMASLAGPAVRGLVLRRGRRARTEMPAKNRASFDWSYTHDRPDMAKLVSAARRGQWNPETDLDWTRAVDPFDPAVTLLRDSESPLAEFDAWRDSSVCWPQQRYWSFPRHHRLGCTGRKMPPIRRRLRPL